MSVGDTLYDRALTLVLEHQKASTSFLQRQLRLGAAQAAELIARMQKEGYVGRPDHVGRREVLRPPSATLAGSTAEPASLTVAGHAEPELPAAIDTRELADEPSGTAKRPLDPTSSDHLRQIIERVETLFEQRDILAGTIRDTFGFAKDIGFDPAAIRAVVKARAADPEKRMEFEATLEVYRHAMGVAGPDFVIELPTPSVPPPPPARKLTAKEKAYRETLAWSAASATILIQ